MTRKSPSENMPSRQKGQEVQSGRVGSLCWGKKVVASVTEQSEVRTF